MVDAFKIACLLNGKIGVLPEEVKKTLIFYIKIVLNSLRSNFYSENQRRKNGNN